MGQETEENMDRPNVDWYNSDVSTIFKYLSWVPLKGKVIGFMVAGGPMMTGFDDELDGLFFNIFPGERYSTSIWKQVTGEVNPSGKLTFTMPNFNNE